MLWRSYRVHITHTRIRFVLILKEHNVCHHYYYIVPCTYQNLLLPLLSLILLECGWFYYTIYIWLSTHIQVCSLWTCTEIDQKMFMPWDDSLYKITHKYIDINKMYRYEHLQCKYMPHWLYSVNLTVPTYLIQAAVDNTYLYIYLHQWLYIQLSMCAKLHESWVILVLTFWDLHFIANSTDDDLPLSCHAWRVLTHMII